MGDLQITEKILAYLSQIQDWSYSSQIAEQIKHNRVTVAKYLDILHEKGLIEGKILGKAKLWRIPLLQKFTVLLADDEPHIVQLVEFTLGKNNYDFVIAKNGLEALEKITENIDLVILDVMMPKIDGFSVLRQIKSNKLTKHIPVIMLTAKGDIADKTTGLTLGVDEYIIKPFDPLELEVRVLSLLKKKNQKTNISTGLYDVSVSEEFLRTHFSKSVYHISLNNFSEYVAHFGYKKAMESVSFLVKFIQHECHLHSIISLYFGHLTQNTFVLQTDSSLNTADLVKKFDSNMPFLYGSEEFIVDDNSQKKFSYEQGIKPILRLHIQKKKASDLLSK